MALPTYQDVMLPLLQAATDQETKISDAIERLAQTYQLSEAECTQLLPSGRQTIFANRVSWARTYLSKAWLLATPRRGFIRLTDEGRQLLAAHPPQIDNDTLMQFASFRAFRTRDHDPVDNGALQPPPILAHATLTPDEILRATHDELEAALAAELLQRIRTGTPAFFEKLIISLLIAMGYGGSVTDVDKALVGKSLNARLNEPRCAQ